MVFGLIERGSAVEQEQVFYVTGMGNLPDSDGPADYHCLTNPTGYGLQAFRAKEGAEASWRGCVTPRLAPGAAADKRGAKSRQPGLP